MCLPARMMAIEAEVSRAHASTAIGRRSDAQMLRCSDAQMLRCSDAQMLRCSDAQKIRRSEDQTNGRTDDQKCHFSRILARKKNELSASTSDCSYLAK